MSKEIEILHTIENDYPREDYKLGSQYDIEFACIENALVRKDKLERVVKLLNNFNMREAFGLDMTLEEFNESWLLDFTQEEFDLLKEAFEKWRKRYY